MLEQFLPMTTSRNTLRFTNQFLSFPAEIDQLPLTLSRMTLQLLMMTVPWPNYSVDMTLWFVMYMVSKILTEFRHPLQVQSHLEMSRILVQLGHTQRT